MKFKFNFDFKVSNNMFRSNLIRGQSAIILETLKQRIITVISFHITTNKVCYRKVDMAPAGGGPGGGCASRPVCTYLYFHAVGASDLVAVLSLAR
jgi:hypothetical protein